MPDIFMNPDRLFLSILFLFLIVCSGVSLAEDDPYLKALEAEAGANSVGGANESELSAQPKVVEALTPQRKEFEKKLLEDRPTTFKTYIQLPDEAKNKVVEEYLSNNKDMGKANRLIFDLYYK